MGNQQLLFIVLGVIIVIIAVITGLDYFQTQAVDSNRDQVILDLNTLANMAQTYHKKNKQLGGGGRSFVGFEIPDELQTTAAGTFTLINTTSTRATIQGVGNESSGTGAGCSQSIQKITYQITVTATESTLRKVY